MKAQYIEEASKIIPQPQILINLVSRRVRQLNAGSRPMVETDLSLGLADIALIEIASGKIGLSPISASEA